MGLRKKVTQITKYFNQMTTNHAYQTFSDAIKIILF